MSKTAKLSAYLTLVVLAFPLSSVVAILLHINKTFWMPEIGGFITFFAMLASPVSLIAGIIALRKGSGKKAFIAACLCVNVIFIGGVVYFFAFAATPVHNGS